MLLKNLSITLSFTNRKFIDNTLFIYFVKENISLWIKCLSILNIFEDKVINKWNFKLNVFTKLSMTMALGFITIFDKQIVDTKFIDIQFIDKHFFFGTFIFFN